MKVTQWWKLPSDENYQVMKVMKVLPVAMFCHIASSATLSYIFCKCTWHQPNLSQYQSSSSSSWSSSSSPSHVKDQPCEGVRKANTWFSFIVKTFKSHLMYTHKITHDIFLLCFIVLLIIFFTILITIFLMTTHFLEPSGRCWGRRRRRFSWSKLLLLESSCCTSSYSQSGTLPNCQKAHSWSIIEDIIYSGSLLHSLELAHWKHTQLALINYHIYNTPAHLVRFTKCFQ